LRFSVLFAPSQSPFALLPSSFPLSSPLFAVSLSSQLFLSAPPHPSQSSLSRGRANTKHHRPHSTLRRCSLIITKLASRSFLKIYLNGDELGGAIGRATQELADCVVVFQVRTRVAFFRHTTKDEKRRRLIRWRVEQLQASISTAAWQVQSVKDRERDMTVLLSKLDEAAENDEKM
jgi:hypothetical protein